LDEVIVIAGKNNIAAHALNILVDKVGSKKIVCVCNENDGGVDGWQRSLRSVAKSENVQISTLEEVYDMNDVEIFISLEFDRIIDLEKIECDCLYNIHFSLLPEYKGVYTSFWPILNGEGHSGVTLHEIDSGIDTGNIIDQYRFEIDRHDRCSDLYSKYIKFSMILFDRNIDRLLSGKQDSKPQGCINSTYYSSATVDFKELSVDLNATAWSLERQIMAYSFREYQLPSISGRTIVGIDILHDKSSCKPGCVIEEDKNSIVMSTVDYNVRLYFDRLNEVLSDLESMPLDEIKRKIKNISGVNDRNEKGWSLIIVAAYYGRRDVVEYLLDCGANVNDANNKGTSVLMYAKEYCLNKIDSSLFKFLLKSGADIGYHDYSGKTILDYVCPDELEFLVN